MPLRSLRDDAIKWLVNLLHFLLGLLLGLALVFTGQGWSDWRRRSPVDLHDRVWWARWHESHEARAWRWVMRAGMARNWRGPGLLWLVLIWAWEVRLLPVVTARRAWRRLVSRRA